MNTIHHPHNSPSPETFILQRIYAAASSEVSGAPEIFEITENPYLDIKLNVESRPCHAKVGNYLVELTVVVTSLLKEKTLFLVEVKQSGIFTIEGVADSALPGILNVHCPMLLYPYASALVSDLILRVGFVPFHLPPVNFHGLYEQKKNESSYPNE